MIDPIVVAVVAAVALLDNRMVASEKSSEWLLYTVFPVFATLPFCFETTPRNSDYNYS